MIQSSVFQIILLSLPLIVATTYITLYLISKKRINIKVYKTERVTLGEGNNIYTKFLVYTEKEVFQNTDFLLFWKFNSGTIQMELKDNQEFTVTVIGWRIPFFSMFRNILKIEQNESK